VEQRANARIHAVVLRRVDRPLRHLAGGTVERDLLVCVEREGVAGAPGVAGFRRRTVAVLVVLVPARIGSNNRRGMERQQETS
jgi:hypothetical protein